MSSLLFYCVKSYKDLKTELIGKNLGGVDMGLNTVLWSDWDYGQVKNKKNWKVKIDQQMQILRGSVT